MSRINVTKQGLIRLTMILMIGNLLVNNDVKAQLFSQNFNNATTITYTANTARSITSASSNNVVGNTAASQFTSLTCVAKASCGIGLNDATYSGQLYCGGGNSSFYWSINKTTNFASTAPNAIKIVMNATYNTISSGSNMGVGFAVGAGFSDGLNSTSSQSNANVHSGFFIQNNSSPKIYTYSDANTSSSNTSTVLSSSSFTNNSAATYTWVINNSGGSLSYTNPAGTTSTLPDDKWDLWIGTTQFVTAAAATTGTKDLQNLYIGNNIGKQNSFTLNDITVTDLSPVVCATSPAITSATAASSTICSSATTTLTANGVAGVNPVVTWYSGTGGTGTNYGTGTTKSVGPGTYYARVTGDCGTAVETSVTVGSKTNVGITSVTAAASSVISSATTTLTANGVTGTNSTITWWSAPGGAGSNLATGTTLIAGPGTYYARVTGDCGTAVEASKTIGTITQTSPTLSSTTISNLRFDSVRVTSAVTSDGYGTILERGFVYGNNVDPTVDDIKVSDADNTTGSMTALLETLSSNTTYYVRSFATNEIDIAYGANQTFTTLDYPTLTTTAASSITSTGASSGGDITSDGGAAITQRGIVYSTSSNPTTADTKIINSTAGTGTYTSAITGLNPATTYYVRAYAINVAGTFYATEKSFTTLAIAPTVTTTAISSITGVSAASGCNVTSTGGASVTERGIVYSTAANPTIADSKITDASNGAGAYTASLTGLANGTTYYVRAYAINSIGTSYGSQVSFTTLNKPTVTTTTASLVTATSASTGGNVTSNGGNAITERGVVYSTAANPTTSDTKITDATASTGSFSTSLTGLASSTTYHIRAYAINSVGTSYGTDESFTTISGAIAPAVTTAAVSDLGSVSVTVGGSLDSDGGASVTERGIVYSSSINPTTADTKIADASTAIGTYSTGLTGLTPGATYHVRAYAINSIATSYGSDVAFTMNPVLATVTTSAASSVGLTTATSGGEVTYDGGGTITERGVVYGLTANPTTSNTKIINGSIGTGSYSSSLSGLTAATTYYLRAYAINAAGTAYGSQIVLTTLALSSVTTTSITVLSGSSASTGGNVTAEGDALVIERGVVYGASLNPTVADTKITDAGTGAGTFVSSLSGLTSNTTYHVRAYAISSLGTSYGSDESFTTFTSPTLTTTAATAITSSTASVGGNVSADGGATIIERGVVYSTSAGVTLANGTKVADVAVTTGAFTISLNGINSGTIYYAKAYATNSVGTSYGTEISFTTSSNFRSKVPGGDWSANATWEMYNGSSWVDANGTPTSASGTITIQSGSTVTVATSVSADELTINTGGQITVAASQTLTINNGAGTDLTVNGYLKNQGTITLSSSPSITVAGTYEHAVNGGTVPAATWSSGSTCLVTGVTSSTSTNGFSQNFYNFTWNCPSQTANLNLAMYNNTISGDFNFLNGGAGSQETALSLAGAGVDSPRTNTITIVGNFNINSSVNANVISAHRSGSISKVNNMVINIQGNLNINSGAFFIVKNSGIATTTWNLNGNMNFTGGSFTTTGTTGSLHFAKNGTQTYTKSGSATFSGGSMFIDGVSTLDLGSNLIDGSVAVTLNAGGGIKSSIATGLNGNLTTSGTKTLSTAGNYEFYGSAASAVTGTLMPATVNNLIINNSNGVSLSQATAINGVLTLTNGAFTTTSSFLPTITNTGTTAISGGSTTAFINGPVKLTLPSSLASGSTYIVPLGKGSTYLPLSLVNPTTGTGAVTATLEAFNANSGGSTLAPLGSLSATEYWSLATTGNFTNSSVSLTRQASLGTLSAIAKSTTLAGTYSSLNGTVSGSSIINSDAVSGAALYFALAEGISLSTGTIAGSPFCGGASVSVPFTVTGTYTSGNVFTAQLSDASGSFASPVNLSGALTQTNSGTITATIPQGTAAGNGYRIRVVSSNPVINAIDNGTNLSINASLNQYSVTGGGAYCNGGTGVAVGLANSDNGVNYQLTLNGTNLGTPVSGTGSAISFGNKTSIGTYAVVATDASTTCTRTMTGSALISTIPTTGSTTNASVCQANLPYTFNGFSFNTSIDTTIHITNVAGCDSAARLVLTVNFATSSTTNQSLYTTDLPFIWNGVTFYGTIDTIVHISNVAGCDSAARLILIVTTLAYSPTVSTGTAAAGNNGITASVTGNNVSADGGSVVNERGIVYGTTSGVTTANTKVIASGTTGFFNSSISGLSTGTTYYVNSYAINGVGTSYGTETSFTTPTVASITTGIAAADNNGVSASVTGNNVTTDGSSIITERGVVYGTTSGVTTSNTKISTSGTTGTFNSSITGLTAGTTYYVNAYVINGVGTSYGTETSFTTPSLASISTTNIGSITPTSAIGGGNIILDGGSAVTERGIVYGTSANPTTANTKLIDGTSGSGSFVSALTGLIPNTTYHIRAYAINGVGTSYGSNVTFTTINNEANINAFSFANQISSSISGTNITVVMPAGTYRYNLAPSAITASSSATVSPSVATAQDFRTSKIYTVTAQDGVTIQNYTVTVSNQTLLCPPDVRDTFPSSFSAAASYTFSSTDIVYKDSTGANNLSTSTSGVCGTSRRTQSSTLVLKLVNQSASKFVFNGTSSGSSTRTITYIDTASSLSGPYAQVQGAAVTSTITGSSCGTITVNGIRIPQGKFVQFYFSGNTNVSSIIVTPICAGAPMQLSTPVVGVANSINNAGFTANWTDVSNEIGYSVNVYQGGTNVNTVSAPANATSIAITGLNPNTTYTYKVTAVGDGDAYTNSNESAASANVCTSSSLFTVGGGGAYCVGAPAMSITLNGTETGVTYQLYNGATAFGSSIAGTGSSITFLNVTSVSGTTTYTVKATATCGTVTTMTGNAVVTKNLLPVATISYAGSPYCPTGTATVNQTGVTGGTYSSTTGLAINSSTGDIDLITSTAGTYTVTYSFNDGNCSNTTTTSVVINAGTFNSETRTDCDSYTWHGIPRTTSGTYTYSYTNASGCNSVDTLYLTINSSTHNVETTTACETYTWNGNSYTSSGTYSYSYTNLSGCSSTDTLHLTINRGTHNAETRVECNSYVWHGITRTSTGTYTYSYNDVNGCPSMDTLHLTITNSLHNSETTGVCDSYTWHGTSYTSTGVYTFSYTNNNGCPSVDTLHLTIYSTTAAITNNSSTTVLTCNAAINLTATGGSFYSWSNGSNVVGNSADISFALPGNYTVSVSNSFGCSSTSSIQITQDPTIPIIISQPSKTARKVTLNLVPVAYTVGVGGSAPFTYQWYRNTNPSNVGGELISGAVSSSYVPSTAVVSTYYYYVVVSNNNGCDVTSDITGYITVCGQ